jgi:hypothetical protein
MRGRGATCVQHSPRHRHRAGKRRFAPVNRAIRHNAPMSVTRIAWLVTVLVALLTGFLLLLGGYNGYAALGLAVAIAAAINLL